MAGADGEKNTLKEIFSQPGLFYVLRMEHPGDGVLSLLLGQSFDSYIRYRCLFNLPSPWEGRLDAAWRKPSVQTLKPNYSYIPNIYWIKLKLVNRDENCR